MAGEIRKSDLIEDKALESIRVDLDAMAVSLEKNDETFKSIAKTLKSDINPTLEKTSKGIREINEAELKSEKLIREKLKNEQELKKVKIAQERLNQAELKTKVAQNKEAERQEKIKQRNIKLTRDENILLDKNAGTLEKIEAKSRLLRKERRSLNLETEKGRKRLNEINRELDRNNSIIEKNSDKLTKQRIGIGRYQKALGGLRRALTTIGVTFGAAQIFRGFTSTIIEFDDAVANLAATSGKTTDELEPLIEQSKQLGATSQFTATEISNLQLELLKLGFSTKEVEQSTEAISNFAAATGADLPSAAQLGGSALRAFGLEADQMERVVSTLGVATTKTALDFSFLETGLSTVAPVAKSFGFSIEDTTALLGQLANAGFDASSAATATRNILLNLADSNGKLAKRLGEPVRNSQELAAALQQLSADGVDLAETLELTDKRSVAAFNTFIEGSDSLVKLTGDITNQNEELKEMAEKRLDSVSGQFKKLTSAIEGYILGTDDANGISDKLKDTLGFLSKNIGTIFDTLGSLLKLFLVYKTRMVVLNALNGKFGAGLKNIAAAFKKGETSGKRFTGGLKALGSALKSIGFTAAIAGAVKLAQAFFDVASGARQARQDALLLDAVVGKVNQRVQEGLDARQKELDQKLQLAKTEKERKQLREDFIKQNRREAASLQENLEKAKQGLELAKKYQKQQSGLMEMQAESADQFFNFFGGDLRDVNDIVGEYEAKVAGLESGISILNVAVQDAKFDLEVYNKEQREASRTTGDTTEEIQDQTEAVEDLEESI